MEGWIDERIGGEIEGWICKRMDTWIDTQIGLLVHKRLVEKKSFKIKLVLEISIK